MAADGVQRRVALVTGAGSGIGRAAALALAAEGARVVAADLLEASAEETARRVRDAGGEALAACADVASAAEVEAMVARAVQHFGRVDLAVFSAGTGGVDARTHEHEEADWRRVLDINLTGVWLCMKHVLPGMLEQGSGVIVNVASVAGLIGYPRHAAYGASKHGVIGLTRAAALEYARRGIRVNAVCPGFTRTPMVEAGLLGGDAAAEEQLTSRIPLGRLGTPEEIAGAIVYLCSDAAAFAVGQCLVLDGGITAA